MYFLLLLLGIVSSTNDNCAYYSAGFPLGDCYYTDSYLFDVSYGYYCGMDNGTDIVEYRSMDNGECSGSTSDDAVFTYTCDSDDSSSYNYCNCDGSLDDCSFVEVSLISCTDSSAKLTNKYIIDLCFSYGASSSSSINCASTSSIEANVYTTSDCSGDPITLPTPTPTTYSCDSESDCDASDYICFAYYDISCKAGAETFKLLSVIAVFIASMLF